MPRSGCGVATPRGSLIMAAIGSTGAAEGPELVEGAGVSLIAFLGAALALMAGFFILAGIIIFRMLSLAALAPRTR